MNSIKKNSTKYSGLSISALIHLIKTPAPVNQLLRREVWKELFYRYFMEGRTFNLYELLHRNPQMFANTIGWELQRENVEIPSAHSSAFMKDLLEFIEFVDKQVLETGIHFEWQLHELNGLSSMIERVRDAKIKDLNLRQKINLFIDKINHARKESLLLIESAKKDQPQEKSSNSNQLVIVQNNKELIITKEKHELMKQELKRLSIPVTKLKRKEWEDAVSEFHLYYREDQDKLIKHGLRKYGFYDHNELSLLAFKLNLQFRIPEVYMNNLLLRSLSYNKKPAELFGSNEALYNVVKEWFFSADGATKEEWYTFSTEFLKKLGGEFARNKLQERALRLMEEVYPLVKQFTGAKLSDVLKDRKIAQEEKGKQVIGIQYKKDAVNWVITTSEHGSKKEMTALERFYKVFDYVRGYKEGTKLVDYDIETVSNKEPEILKDVAYRYHQMIRDFCQFPSSLTIDEGMFSILDDPSVQSLYAAGFYSRSHLTEFIKHKFNSGYITDHELSYLFKTEKGQYLFEKMTQHLDLMQGWLKRQGDFIGRFFDRTLNLFDFKIEEDRKMFFRLPLEVNEFYRGYGYLKKEYVDWVADKLRSEAPHEHYLISEYFSNIDETYEDYKIHEMFEYLSDFERLLLERDGIKTGGTIKHRGYKENDVYYTSEEAKNKFLFEYFQELYKEEQVQKL